jgi:hypothetical protein|tara:strand:+ start:22 stop:231 length:210 start_codon:yes stop_codon:yes gene_type:complete
MSNKEMYEVRLALTGQSQLKWYAFDTAKEAVKFALKAMHEEGFTVSGKTFEEKFEELEWIGKGRVHCNA